MRKLNGVSWYNDSKGTNVGSVLKSLAGLPSGVTLIAGGKDKGGDYTLLRPLLEQKVEYLLLIGEAAEKMANRVIRKLRDPIGCRAGVGGAKRLMK